MYIIIIKLFVKKSINYNKKNSMMKCEENRQNYTHQVFVKLKVFFNRKKTKNITFTFKMG